MLSPKAQQLIHNYLNLPFKGVNGVRCPYFNNARLKQRGQLRVLVGKGTPGEIAEEAYIISVQKHAGFFEKTGECCLHNQHTGSPTDQASLKAKQKFEHEKVHGLRRTNLSLSSGAQTEY